MKRRSWVASQNWWRLTGTVASVVALVVVASASKYSESSVARLHSLLMDLGELPRECPTQCSYHCWNDDKHDNSTASQGTNMGTTHSCQFTEGGCTDHTCGTDVREC